MVDMLYKLQKKKKDDILYALMRKIFNFTHTGVIKFYAQQENA